MTPEEAAAIVENFMCGMTDDEADEIAALIRLQAAVAERADEVIRAFDDRSLTGTSTPYAIDLLAEALAALRRGKGERT